jgi:DNA-binding CsgD family transcriptional regulator/tetratricopeptide (TPR) repeat protein
VTTVSRASTTPERLLEREDALAALHGAYSEARTGTGRLVLVGGEAGVGKTALLRTFGAALADRSRVLVGACDPLFAPRPLAPFVDIAAQTNGSLRETIEAGAGAPAVFEAIRDELASPKVLVLEDLHWADEATLDVVRMLGRRIEGIPSLVVGSYRDELERLHPLRIVLGELGAVAGVENVHLDPLSADAVAELAGEFAVDAHELYRTTAGNPFYVHEVLDAGGEVIPDTIRGVVLARIAALCPEARSLVEDVSLAPPQMEAWLMERVCDIAHHIDECLDAGVLASTADSVSFRHEIARMAVEETVSPAHRLAVHRRILEALAAPPSGRPDLARLAHHAEAAMDRGAVLRYAPAAAREASAAGAFREAAAQYARALRFAAASSPGERAALLEGRSRACYLADDQLEAIAVIKEAIAHRSAEGAPLDEARDLCELTDYLLCRGLYTQAREAVAKATDLVAEQPETGSTAYVLWTRSRMSDVDGNLDECLALARHAVDLADRCGDARIAAEARITIGSVELYAGHARGRELLERVAAECREQGLVEQTAHALNNLGAIGALRHDHALADTFLPEALEYCVQRNLDLWRINVLAYLARSQLDQGRWTQAAESATELLRDPRESPWPQCEALRVLALVRARRGDPGAHEALDTAMKVGLSPEETFAVVALATARAEVAWLERRPDDVDRATSAELESAIARGAAGDVAQLTYWRRLASLDNPDATGTDPYALGSAGSWREAAEEWTRRGCPYETAVALAAVDEEAALLRAIEASQRLGARPLANLAARRLRELGANGVPRGPRASTRENPAQLTVRELEVLRLLAEGLRNAEIAHHLVLSRRTIDHHVSAILRKLQARTRVEAVAAAGRLGLLQDR